MQKYTICKTLNNGIDRFYILFANARSLNVVNLKMIWNQYQQQLKRQLS